MTDRDFVDQLVDLRVKAGLRQRDVADMMGVARVTVARFESIGRRSPSLFILRRYAHAVGARIELVGGCQ